MITVIGGGCFMITEVVVRGRGKGGWPRPSQVEGTGVKGAGDLAMRAGAGEDLRPERGHRGARAGRPPAGGTMAV